MPAVFRLTSLTSGSILGGALVACAAAVGPELEQPVGMTRATSAEAPAPPAPSVIEKREALRDSHAAKLERQEKRRIIKEYEELGTVEEIDGPRDLDASSDILFHHCDLPNTPSDAPQFPFDSAALRPRGQQILDQVANCMKHGELLGASVVVFGYADPVGSKTYNLKLAMDRARTARWYLIQRGIHPARVTVASRGEHYARGLGPEGRRRDRRVEIQIARTGR